MNHSSGSSTVTSLSNSRQLSSSTSSLSPTRKTSPELTKLYKHASELFLTRRLGEALMLLRPILTPTQAQANGYSQESDSQDQASISTAATSQRIKLWNLYITVLSSIADLSYDEGATEVGHKEYKEIRSHVQNGGIWEQVVRDGYKGREGSVDAEVVYNLANLLLQHSADQQLTQARLETYISSSHSPSLDISQTSMSSPSRRQSLTNGASTPRDLSSRLKILEIFTLHVLPSNEEWEYARAFINGSDLLDEERREMFLQTLQEIEEVHSNEARAEEMEKLREEELQRQRDQEARHAAGNALNQQTKGQSVNSHKRSSSEVDYGIEAAKSHSLSQKNIISPSMPIETSKQSSSPSPPIARRNRHSQKPKARQPPSALGQLANLLRALRSLLTNSIESIMRNPVGLVKMFAGLVTILFVFGRKEVRERLRRTLQTGWGKLVQTGKMGGKVSYI